MRLQGGGSQDFNQLISDAAQFRNADFASAGNLAFMGDGTQVAVAAEFSIVQILNPAASGKTLLIDGILASADTAGRVAVFEFGTALTALVRVWRNMNLGGPAGVGQVRKQSNVGALGTDFAALELPANGSFFLPMEFPAILDEGEGIIVLQAVVNTTVSATFWGREL